VNRIAKGGKGKDGREHYSKPTGVEEATVLTTSNWNKHQQQYSGQLTAEGSAPAGEVTYFEYVLGKGMGTA